MKTSEYHAPDIECAGCADSIKRSLGKLAGVVSVEVDVGSKLVRVAYDEALASSDQVKSRLEASGFPASERR